MLYKKMENLASVKTNPLETIGMCILFFVLFPLWFPLYWISRFWNTKGE